MPATEREVSSDREAVVKHQHSWSESGRGSVPMWDSSDPDRAPPPLPLNPGASSPTTKANTSAGIAAAAKQIVERARESAPLSSYTSNRDSPQTSPERSLVKGAHHKRMQTMQTLQSSSVKDLRNYLDNRSPERSPERPSSVSGFSSFSRQDSREDILERSSTPTPAPRDPLKDTPSLRPTSRPGPRPLLGENTPPSATMLALQTMQVPEQPLNDITNGPSTPTPSVSAHGNDFSGQLLNLTNIATGLQKEMAALSRRSKDNATDLLSLKDATSKRDEDIRKSLRQLAVTQDKGLGMLDPPPLPGAMSRSTSSFTTFLDSKPFTSPPSATLPRVASAHSFLEDRVGSPSPFSVEGAASVAMLEKIIREMVTKEGQERLQSSLSELLEKSRKENSDAAKKVEELSEFIKDKSQSHALVRVPKDGPPRLDLNFESPQGAMSKTREAGGKEARMLGNDEDLMKMLERIKDSVTHTGGTTAEVKGLVRDLRGEILGMGRDLGKKLESVTKSQLDTALDRSIADGQDKLDADDVQRIIEESMSELKGHVSGLVRSRNEQDDETFRQLANTRGGADSDEMLAVVKHALAEHSDIMTLRGPTDSETTAVDRESILATVKEGLQDFEPNIELQQFGLERDEILSTLKEGLEEYQSSREPAFANIDKGEVYEAMQEALKDFRAPLPQEQIDEMKEDLLSNLRQALEEYQPATSRSLADDEATRIAIVEAVREGLANHDPPAPRALEINRDDLFDAVKFGLDGQGFEQLHELIDGMKAELHQYTAAGGRDTEQVLDAMRNGLESLRAEVENYVDRAQDVTGKDEILDTIKAGLEQLRADIYASTGTRDIPLDRDVSASPHAAEIILALKEGMDELKSHVSHTRGVGLDDEPSDEMQQAMKEEFEQLKSALLNASAHDKSELIETIQDSMGALHAKFNGSELSNLTGGATEEVINEMHAEFSQLKESLQSIIGDVDRDAIVAGVRQSIDDLRTQLSADQSDAAAESLEAIKEELEKFKETMGSSLVVGGGSGGLSDEALTTIRSDLDEIKENVAKEGGLGVTDELLEAIQGEFEKLRDSIATSVVHGGPNEDLLDAVRIGLDDLRSHMDVKLDNPDHQTSQHGEVLDVINEGLETLRADVIKTLDKPLDMTVNYEILDTLKDGLAELRADIDKLKSADGTAIIPKCGEIVLADGGEFGQTRDFAAAATAPSVPAAAANSVERADLEKIEVGLAQLQIKVEALSSTLLDLPSMRPTGGTAMKDDIIALETILKEIQDNVASVGNTDRAAGEDGPAMKEDTDAIETLLRNTRAQLEDMALPDPSNVVTKDQLDSVEAVVRMSNEAIDGLADRLENSTAAKADVAVVEVLAQDLKSAVDELKDRIPIPDPNEEKPDVMTKADLDVLGVMCTEIKTTVNEMVLPDPDDLPSKADVEQLHGLITDFRESHEKLKDSYENDISITAKAFDDRKQEFVDTVQQITEVKESLADIKDGIVAKLGDGEASLDSLAETLSTLEERADLEPVAAEIKSMLENVALEFGRTHTSLDTIQTDHQKSAKSSLEKQAEHKQAVVDEIGDKLETYFDGLMSKYDDAQRSAEDQARVMEDKATAQEELLNSMKVMADDLRLSIDTLGTTLTSLPDTVEKITEESKYVFTKVDDTYNKLDETQEGVKYEHSITREEVAKVMAAVEGVQSDITEHNPRFMVTLKEVQALIGQHYEHSQKASETAAEHAQTVKELQEQIRGIGSQNEELMTNVSSLPRLMPADTTAENVGASERNVAASERYDDSAVHEKLDKLVGHAEEASKGSVQLERLDEIHEKVMATATEVSAFVAMQAKQIAEDHESKEKEAEELALLLERRQVQKDEIEADITVLNEEKESVGAAVEALKAEREALAAQKSRLAAEVSSLETAMHIRREELHDMDRKAETIERRMLEGVMNQSRMLLLAKGAKPAPKKKPQGRDLRIPSDASAASAQTVTSSVPALKANHSLAMKSRPNMQRNGPLPNTAERRIMSLNQINHNIPTGGSAFSPAPSIASAGSHGLKRSHSVKTQYPTRKPSWAGKRELSFSSQNKENETLSEESDEDMQRPESRDADGVDVGSDEGTERRTSYMSGTEGRLAFGEGNAAEDITLGIDEDRRPSYGTSEISYGTGSYITGSEIDRRTSLGSSANGVLGMTSTIDEEPSEEEYHDLSDREEEEQAVEEAPRNEPLQIEAPPAALEKKGLDLYAPPSDSGLGTDMPTAALSSVGFADYFRE